uniref:Odorant-binding protein 4 n=1 Tax=Chilo suppressalis TaxID=168631 RepID=M9YRR4_CHISP|nr:odorant-binding protein 4 [Chilo suppressalis]
MFRLFLCLVVFVTTSYGDLLTQERSRGATLKPISACCGIPELGDSKPLTECSKPKLLGPCNDIQCVFEKSGFLVDRNTLNKDVYKKHLRKWAEAHDSWTEAVERAIADCVDKELRQYLDYPCRAYDVFTCTGIAMLKKCPQEAWKC